MLLLANGEFNNFCFAEDLESMFSGAVPFVVEVLAAFDEAGDDDEVEVDEEESSKVKYSKCNHSICSFVSEAKLEMFAFDRGFDWLM